MTAPVSTDAVHRDRAIKVVAIIVATLVAINLVLLAIDSVGGPDPSGPPSSSYSTASGGLGAFAELLEGEGHTVTQVRERLQETTLDPSATLVVADAVLEPDEAAAVGRFVRAGGRLVATGEGADAWLAQLMGAPPAFGPEAVSRASTLVPVPETAGVSEVLVGEVGVWTDPRGALPVVAGDGEPHTLVTDVGSGRVVLLASTGPLRNALLDEADNAAFALAIVGGRGEVLFAERPHGFGTDEGWAAIPGRWRWLLAGLGVAGLVWIGAKARRLGPPSSTERELGPARREFVDAMGGTLARTSRPYEAVAPVRDRALDRIATAVGLGRDATPGELRAAAERLGLPADEIDAVLGRAKGPDALVATGRALARLEGRTTRRGRT